MSVCGKNVDRLTGCIQRQMGRSIYGVVSEGQPNPSWFCYNTWHSKIRNAFAVSRRVSRSSVVSFQTPQGNCFQLGFCKQRGNLCSLALKRLVIAEGSVKNLLDISSPRRSMSMRFLLPKQSVFSKIKCDVAPISWKRGCASTRFAFSMLACYSSYKSTYAKADGGQKDEEDGCDLSYVKSIHGKRVYTEYTVIGIPGDGRCLFRSLAHGACLRSGKKAPNERIQKELADELRARVADEFIKRREESEWFVEGDFDSCCTNEEATRMGWRTRNVHDITRSTDAYHSLHARGQSWRADINCGVRPGVWQRRSNRSSLSRFWSL